MTEVQYSRQPEAASESTLIRVAIWVAIGALIAAAIVCVVWVLIGSQNGLIGRAFLTILLLAAFAGVAILEARLAARRPPWFALTSMVVWVVTLLLGAFLIWMPERSFGFGYGSGFGRFLSFLLIVLILQLAVLHVRLYVKAYQRNISTFTTVVTITTVALVAILAFMLVFSLAFDDFLTFSDTYWRWVVAFAILAAVGTALVPLVNALFAPRRPVAPAPPVDPWAAPIALQPWPTYADGVTPLPILYDGSPDWNAYYTGYPTATAQAIAPTAPVATPAPSGWPEPAAAAWPEPAAAAWPEPSQHPSPSAAWSAPQSPVDAPQPPVDTAQPQPLAPDDPAAHAQAWSDLGQQQGWSAQPATWGRSESEIPWGEPGPQMPSAPGYQGYPPPPPLPPRS